MDSLTCLPQHPVSHGLPFPSTLAICEPHKSSQKRPHQKSLQIHHQNHQLRFHFQTNELLGQRSLSAPCVPWNLHQLSLSTWRRRKIPQKGGIRFKPKLESQQITPWSSSPYISSHTGIEAGPIWGIHVCICTWICRCICNCILYLYLYQQRSWGWPYLRHLRLLC